MTLEAREHRLDRQALLAAIPDDWKTQFKQQLARSPILRLVALQVSQQVMEVYRQRLETALRSGEMLPRRSPYVDVSQDATGQPIVRLTRAGETRQKPLAATEERVAQFFQAVPFWESAATYMWHDLTQIACTALLEAQDMPLASGQLASGQPGSGQSSSGQSAHVQPDSVQPGSGQPGSGQPGNGLADAQLDLQLDLRPKPQRDSRPASPPTSPLTSQARSLEALHRYIFDQTSDSLTSNFSDSLAVYIDRAVQQVLTKDDLANKSLPELEVLLGLGPKTALRQPLTHPDLFTHTLTHNFATCKLLWESVNVLTQRTDLLWQPDEDGKLAYTRTLNDGRGKLIFWVTDDLEAQSPESLAGEAALTVIETFDIRAACMHLIYAAHVTTLERPWEEEFVIDDGQIAAYLGLDKRKDLTKEKRLKLIERIAEQPAQILTFLHWPQQGQIESFYVEKSRLWEVAIGYHGQRDIFGGIKCTGLTIRCRAGMWAKYFLNKRGADQDTAFYQYGVLSKTLLQTINRVWQHSEGAARLLSWLSFKMRVGTNQTILTATLMEVAYGAVKVAAAQGDRDLRSELANTWDNDLRILCDAGMIVEFDPVTYPMEIQPDWTEGGRGLNKRPKGFWEQLRTSKLRILPPADIADGIAKLQRKKKTSDPPTSLKRSSQAPPLSGEQIKAAREAKGWSQEELGQQLSRTKMWVSLIERGKRSIKAEDAAQLQDILGK
jgi:DNA-binding transcriptional regulator YiaG